MDGHYSPIGITFLASVRPLKVPRLIIPTFMRNTPCRAAFRSNRPYNWSIRVRTSRRDIGDTKRNNRRFDARDMSCIADSEIVLTLGGIQESEFPLPTHRHADPDVARPGEWACRSASSGPRTEGRMGEGRRLYQGCCVRRSGRQSIPADGW